MRKLLNLVFALLLAASPALAGSGTLNYAPSGTSPMRQTIDGSSNNLPNMTLWDSSAGAYGLVIDSSGRIINPALAATAAGQGLSPFVTNPTSTLTTPASTTTAYSAGQLISNNATAGSIVVPSFVIANSGGGAVIAGLTLGIADTTSTAWPSALIQIDLWRAAPTFTNGDRGVYLVSTGTANYVGSYSCLMGPASGDGYYGACTPMGPALLPVSLSSTSTATIFWTMKAVTTGGTVGASKVFTVTAQALN